jgi:hypothetical protein
MTGIRMAHLCSRGAATVVAAVAGNPNLCNNYSFGIKISFDKFLFIRDFSYVISIFVVQLNLCGHSDRARFLDIPYGRIRRVVA